MAREMQFFFLTHTRTLYTPCSGTLFVIRCISSYNFGIFGVVGTIIVDDVCESFMEAEGNFTTLRILFHRRNSTIEQRKQEESLRIAEHLLSHSRWASYALRSSTILAYSRYSSPIMMWKQNFRSSRNPLNVRSWHTIKRVSIGIQLSNYSVRNATRHIKPFLFLLLQKLWAFLV